MTNSSPPGQHPYDVHAMQPWTRLHHDGKMVGYSREYGDTVLFSKDGYGWSGDPIAYDREVVQLRRQLHQKRIYHGDIVRMSPEAGAQQYSLQIVLTDGVTDYLCDLQSRRLMKLNEAWPPPSSPRAREIIGSMYGEPRLAKVVDRSFRQLTGGSAPSFREVLVLALFIAFSLLVVGGLQIGLLGYVGPVSSSFGALAGAVLFFWLSRRRDGIGLKRHWVLKLAVRVGAFHGVLWGLSSLALTVGGYMGGNDDSSDIKIFAMAALGALVGLTSVVIGGDLVAWRTGGYSGESKAQSSFRDLT
ncbi:MAG: hypothetical protein VYA30_01840 [Myxococcota bacterium]|nr:hypothetical protein [Myxococcota bacterium]